MPKVFLGMNPYLEQPELWNQFHNRLIIAIADALTSQIVPVYHVSIEERVYTNNDDSLAINLALEITERFLEIKSTRTGEVVTVIKVLSPKNKRSKDGRQAYENKRLKIFASNTSLVEIDLLRAGEPMPISAGAKTDYYILVSRGYQRPDADLYAFTLRDTLPAFRVPLKQGDTEPVLDLQQLLHNIYERARFDLAINYSQPAKPPLSPEDIAWAWEILGTSK
ncbi:hypothetical protein NIES2101_29095 [Calothrix sp. HK-06]|nr:hypothetical protein NIES2101_29095 [Calothrix sp. HK-06]